MPNWNGVLQEIRDNDGKTHEVRKKYLEALHKKTGRNIIAYYSGAFSNVIGPSPVLSINDDDKNGFMTAIHGLDRSKGLDLMLHTPGGNIAATESIVQYLRDMFGTDIRAIIPQVAMSAGTMIACACDSILMGKQSNLGPIDPQINGIPAKSVVAEFQEALEQIKKDPACLPLWQTIIGKYHPTFLGECQRAIDWSRSIVEEWLATGMFNGEPDHQEKAKEIAERLSDNNEHYVHSRHIHIDQIEKLGLKVQRLEEDDELQDLVLTIHHTFMYACQNRLVKVVENHEGVGIIHHQGQPQVLGATATPVAIPVSKAADNDQV